MSPLLLPCNNSRCFAQIPVNNPSLFFDHINLTNGLSHETVNCLFQDRQGFIWVGTAEGLNKFDGISFATYHHNAKDSNSLINNDIQSLAEDKNGNLWIGTGNGLSKLDPRSRHFENFQYNPKDPHSLSNNLNVFVMTDSKGQVWAGTNSKLNKYDPVHHNFQHFSNYPSGPGLDFPKINLITSLFMDSHHRFWIATFDGIFLFNEKESSFKRFGLPRSDPHSQSGNLLTRIFEDHLHQLWMGSWDGLHKLDPEKGEFTTYLPGTVIFSIAETKMGKNQYALWLATDKYGLIKMDNAAKQFFSYRYDPFRPNTISSNFPFALYTGKANLLWIGTKDNGLNTLDPNKQFFTVHRFHKNTDELHTGVGLVTGILEDGNKIWLAGWYGDPLFQFDRNLRLIKKWTHIPPHFTNDKSTMVSCIYKDEEGIYWLAGFNGLVRYDAARNDFKVFQQAPPFNRMLQVMPAGKDELWIANYKGGLSRFNKHSGLFVHYLHKEEDPRSIVSNDPWAIYRDRQYHLWIGTNNGLSLYNPATDNFTNFTAGKDAHSLVNNEIDGITADAKNNIWLATAGGVSELNLKTGQFTNYTTADGMASDKTYSLQFDHRGRLWIITANGLSMLDTGKGTFRNFYRSDGLPTNNLEGILYKDGNGKFYIGANGSLITFYPDSLTFNGAVPPVFITDMLVRGKPIPLPVNKGRKRHIHLSYDQNTLAFNFSVLNYTNPQENKYYYQLQGFDNAWNYAGNKGFANYTNLPAGNFIFRVKGSNNDGVMNAAGDFIEIFIPPPFWLTWWFRTLLIAAVALVIYLIFRYRVKSIRRQEELKTAVNRQMADLRLKMLRTQMNPHFLFNALNSIQECIYKHQTEAASIYLTKFSRLVRMILAQSEHDFIRLTLEIEILSLYLELESLRFEQDFSYTIRTDQLETDLFFMPPLIEQPFVENALWHGLAGKEGTKKLTVQYYTDENFLYAVIEDNGIGREAAEQNNNHQNQPSMGIQIATKQLEMMGKAGKQKAGVQIEDLHAEGGLASGTRVTLIIPLRTG